jgi:DNA-binding LytR/AlgR family response regulator
VVEDEWPARNYIVELLEASALASVVGAVGSIGEARLALALTHGEPAADVVFVDVNLGRGREDAGLDLVRGAAGSHPRPMFVLATAYRDHALEAFQLGVDDYLLKPFTEERVEECLRRLHARRQPARQQAPLRIVARRGRGLVFLDRHEVWAFEAAERLTFVHTPHGTFDLDLSLSAIEACFGPAVTRVHRKWLVNAAQIKEFDRDGGETRIFVGAGIGPDQKGVRVPVARDRVQSLREMLLASATGVRRP